MSKIESRMKEVFIDATRRTFSEMAFLDVSNIEAPESEPGYNQVFYLAFLEPEQGYAALFLPLECKKTIVENIYGEEWKNLVPPAVAAYLQDRGLVERFRREFGLATLALEAPID